ncbi:MAG: hypothetical protein Q8K79_13650 [Solirubrobacteraceae bacterium]|nr:hypothetical protein [Solirubrobacteraceae bacterium]
MHLPARWRTVASATTAALAAIALSAGSAAADAGPSPGGCPDVPTGQPFSPWQDFADYFLAPDGDFEAGASSWQLEDGAAVVEGNEPFVGAAGDHRSLRLPAGASATSAPMCIGEEHRTMRFVAMSTDASPLRVEALYTKHNGQRKSVTLGNVRGTDAWAPSDVLAMRVNEDAGEYGDAMSVSLRFSARGNATWQIDGVHVDPFRTK